MNINFYENNLNLKYNNGESNYYLSIRDNNNNTFQEVYITENEFNIIKSAIKYNNGIINLLGHKKEVYSLYRKGLVEISNDNLEVVKVSDLLLNILSPKTLKNNKIKSDIDNGINNSNTNDINTINTTNDIDNIDNILDINSLFNNDNEEYLLNENRPNSIFKIFGNISACFCCLV